MPNKCVFYNLFNYENNYRVKKINLSYENFLLIKYRMCVSVNWTKILFSAEHSWTWLFPRAQLISYLTVPSCTAEQLPDCSLMHSWTVTWLFPHAQLNSYLTVPSCAAEQLPDCSLVHSWTVTWLFPRAQLNSYLTVPSCTAERLPDSYLTCALRNSTPTQNLG